MNASDARVSKLTDACVSKLVQECALTLADATATEHVTVLSSADVYRAAIFEIVDDEIEFAAGDVARRQYMRHDDAVAVVPLRLISRTPSEMAGESEVLQVALIRQYRHASRRVFWEVPAGLCDVPGEEPAVAAHRELAEETGLHAQRLVPLVSFFASPGCSNENLDCFAALGMSELPTEEQTFRREAEEAEIELRWWDFSQVLEAVQRRDLRSPTLVASILAIALQRAELVSQLQSFGC